MKFAVLIKVFSCISLTRKNPVFPVVMKVEIKRDILAPVLKNKIKPKLMVVSHERSGTHFLLNSLANSFGYYKESFDFDYSLGINFFDQANIMDFFMTWTNVSLLNIIKSHHNFYFFDQIIDQLLQDYKILYIYRDPRDIMVSYWNFLNHCKWHEGPKVDNISDFIKSAPKDNMLRYQKAQEETILDRWNTHIKSWVFEPNENTKNSITYVSYEDLNKNYETEMQNIAEKLNMQMQKLERPQKNDHIIEPEGPGTAGNYKEHLSQEDLSYFKEKLGHTMQKLGYSDD